MSELFTTIKTEGGLLPSSFISRIIKGDTSIKGTSANSYHLIRQSVNEAASRSWINLLGIWENFVEQRKKIAPGEPANAFTRERWLLPLFSELGYGRLQRQNAIEIEGKSFPISHMWKSVPIHLLGIGVELDKRNKGVSGAATNSPYGMLQQFLNISEDHLWAFLSNGSTLRILRDNFSFTRIAHVEFDLEAMMNDNIFSDFLVLWSLCHQSRVEADPIENCYLELWAKEAKSQGSRALDKLRDGVERAIVSLGEGFIANSKNQDLHNSLRVGSLSTDDYYNQILHLIYQLLFLSIAEDRDLLQPIDQDNDKTTQAYARYIKYYSLTHLRSLAAQKTTRSDHGDLWQGYLVVANALGKEEGEEKLGLIGLGSFLWESSTITDLSKCHLSNYFFLKAIRNLGFFEEQNTLTKIDYKNLGSEELGAVYESLLEQKAEVNVEHNSFKLKNTSGNQRKTTGSYYTPTALVHKLLDTALDPLINRAMSGPDPQRALLDLKVLDPACGSGHFLIAAAERIAYKLATLRVDGQQPSILQIQIAQRDVIAHCIYGVDLNGMAVELTKFNLWIASLLPGKPLSFLDHHIKQGNSLIGATPEVIREGIITDSFTYIEGDDKQICFELKKINSIERKGIRQLDNPLNYMLNVGLFNLAQQVNELDYQSDDSFNRVKKKERQWAKISSSSQKKEEKFLADAWCASFFIEKNYSMPVLTHEVFKKIQENPVEATQALKLAVDTISEEYSFFHWYLEFPHIFLSKEDSEVEKKIDTKNSGFDVVLTNPPWRKIELSEKEFFTSIDKVIAGEFGAKRKAMIIKLEKSNPSIFIVYKKALRNFKATVNFLKKSTLFPLSSNGKINLYSVFSEKMISLINTKGKIGTIVPSGIASDDTNKKFFADLVSSQTISSLYDFENKNIFTDVHSSFKFSLLTLTGSADLEPEPEFVFFAHSVADLDNSDKVIRLTKEDFSLLNPNTLTCPIIRSARDLEIAKTIYQKVPIFIKEDPQENPWGVRFWTMFNMTTHSSLFQTKDDLEEKADLEGTIFLEKDGTKWLPLYEAKMVHQFDHRWAGYIGDQIKDFPIEEKKDVSSVVLPRYWISEGEVKKRLGDWDRDWLIGFRNIARSTDEGTVIASVIPISGVGHSIQLLFLDKSNFSKAPLLLACLSSFVLDFVTRLKMGGTNLSYFIFKQLPILTPEVFNVSTPWSPNCALTEWISSRVIELTYTSLEMRGWAKEMGYEGEPFQWDEKRRRFLRAELDACFFYLYGLDSTSIIYIMNSFSGLAHKEKKEFGEYLTKRLILEQYDFLINNVKN